ncbi:MAG: MbeD family mobilization/exclusion protein [Phycisphaerae bacterium]|nr:MbeD family mobilization/exclusion protein [Phycisphaerae bacterium]
MAFHYRATKISLALAAGLALVAALPAAGQSAAELRRENERLRARVTDLEQQLQSLTEQIARLQQQLTAAATAGGTTVPPFTPDPISIDESKPDASPRALLATLTESYRSTLDGVEMGEPGDPTRVAFVRQLNRWIARVNREHKMPIEWHVRHLGSIVPVGRGYLLRMQAVDPKTGATLGDPFDGILSRSVRSRLQQLSQRGLLEDVLVLRGTLVPRVMFNEDRLTEGPFNNPPIIAPMAEFGFTVNVTTLLPPRDEDEPARRSGAAATPAAGGDGP